LDAIKYIHKEEGIAGFYKGLTASYAGCFEGAIQWMIYEKLKSKLIPHDKENISNPEEIRKNRRDVALKLFAIAALSKFSAIALTYPHEVVRTRMREQAVNGVFKYSGFFQTLQCVAAEEGVR
jgi:solute carrier family 25 protein 33/36